MPPKKNNRGRVGAAHFVVAFLKSYPKPKAGPYDIRTIVFERQTFRSTKSQHETLLRCVIESDGGTKHLLQNHNHGKPHATCRNAASPQLRFEKYVVFLDHVLCSSCFFHVHHVSMFSFFYFEPLQNYGATMNETTATNEPEFSYKPKLLTHAPEIIASPRVNTNSGQQGGQKKQQKID